MKDGSKHRCRRWWLGALSVLVLTCLNTEASAAQRYYSENSNQCNGCGQECYYEGCNDGACEAEECDYQYCCPCGYDYCYHCDCGGACTTGNCCYPVEYVDYTPWEDGMDPGLYCLPYSRCTYSCPTCPSGAGIYRNIGGASHELQYPSKYSPEEWKTIMLHMRAVVPMTACDTRKVTSFLQERPYKSRRPYTSPNAETRLGRVAPPADENAIIAGDITKTEGEQKAPSVVGAASEVALATPRENGLVVQGDESFDDMSLEEMVGPVSTVDVGFLEGTAIESGSWTPRLNHVFTGFAVLEYSSPGASFFDDFNGNKGFFTGFAPIFLTRYGDNLLFAARMALYNSGQSITTILPYAYVAYFYNDYLTFMAGKYIVPLGMYWEKYSAAWCDKSATLPLIRGYEAGFPESDIGVMIKGAIPLCCLGDCFRRAKLGYEIFIGNGPSEVNSDSPDPRYPIGSIYFSGGNAPNNNNDLSRGGRLSFMPNDCDIFGISWMKSRWDSNTAAFGSDRKLHYEAAAFDWNMNWDYTSFKGEYAWSQWETGNDFHWARVTGYWAELAFQLGILKCYAPSVYCCRPCLWDSLELALRTEGLWSKQNGKSAIFFDYSGFDKKRFSTTLSYYFTQSFIARLGYDYNYGETAFHPLREKTVGFSENVLTFRIVYGW